MDPVTTALLAALATGAASGAPKAVEKIVVDAYDGLKAILRQKFGKDSEVLKATTELETKPDSAGRKETLKEEIGAAKADQDPDILEAAQALLDLIKAQPGGEQHIQSATGSYIAQADRGGTAHVNVNQPKD